MLKIGLGVSDSRSDIPGKFLNVMLEKDGEDQLDRLCKKLRSLTQRQEGQECCIYNKEGSLPELVTSCIETTI